VKPQSFPKPIYRIVSILQFAFKWHEVCFKR
jgi:hypothetical protein